MSKKNVTHHQLIDNIAAERDLKRDEVYSLYEDFIDELLEHLWNGETVVLNRVATFEIVVRDEHQGRNPSTNEEITIPRRRVVKVRNRSDLNKVAAELDENDNAIVETESHPTVIARRERDARRAEREAENLKKRENAKEVRKRKREVEQLEARKRKAEAEYQAAVARADEASARESEEEYLDAESQIAEAQREYDESHDESSEENSEF